MVRARPAWGWSGAAELDFSDQDSFPPALLAMLTRTKSSNAEIVAYLVDLRAHFHRWLHQDEFGPDRAQQTAALRNLRKSLATVQEHLLRASASLRAHFDAALLKPTDLSRSVTEALYEASVDIEKDLRTLESHDRDVLWLSRFRNCIALLMTQIEALDTNTDGAIHLTAIKGTFDPLQTVTDDFGLAGAEHWLHAYRSVLSDRLTELNSRGGAQERVSLKLLVEQLCELWEDETGSLVTAHGIQKDKYTSRAETIAGRFVTAAVEAMLPNQPWLDAHKAFAHSSRARTFLPDCAHDRARQILVIMRDFVRRRSKTIEGAAAQKMGVEFHQCDRGAPSCNTKG